MRNEIKRKKVAFIGSGISTLGCAYILDDLHDIKIFEKNKKFGGHSNTVDIENKNGFVSVDTGFIVFNESNYPNLTSFFKVLEVPVKWSDMSFGFSSKDRKLEYSCDNLDKIFAQKSNLVNPFFLKGIYEILRFNKHCLGININDLNDNYTLGSFLEDFKYNNWFKNNFILPMGAAIWSTPLEKMLDFPIKNFISFFKNHDLLNGLSPSKRWKTIEGGSKVYVEKVIKKISKNVFTSSEVVEVKRDTNKVKVVLKGGYSENFDHVIFSIKGPEITNIFKGQDNEEKKILSHFEVSKNRVLLHSDHNLMPKLSKVWSSWNFISDNTKDLHNRPSSVTYWMNRLQTIDKNFPLFVSLNPIIEPNHNLIFDEFSYLHPIYKSETFNFQKKINHIQGRGGIWYTGAWLGYGFHEDGLVSGLRVAKSLGCEKDWFENILPHTNDNMIKGDNYAA